MHFLWWWWVCVPVDVTCCFHSCYDDVVRKMFPTQSIFHQPGQMEVRKCQIWIIWWLWWNSPAEIGNVLHCLQSGMGPGIIVLQEKGPLSWSDSGLSLQLISHNVAVSLQFVPVPGSTKGWPLIEALFGSVTVLHVCLDYGTPFIATAEMHYSPPFTLFTSTFFFLKEQFDGTPLLHKHFQVRCHLSQGNKM